MNELEVSKNPLQLESVEKRNGGEPPTSTDNKHDVKQSDNDELNQELYDLPKEFRQHLKEYISTQNNNSQNIKDESKTKETVVNTKKIKESYEVEAEQLGFQNHYFEKLRGWACLWPAWVRLGSQICQNKIKN